MIAQIIDGFSAKLKKAMDDGDYEEIRRIDLACVRFMDENLKNANQGDLDELQALMSSLAMLNKTYEDVRNGCASVRDDLQQALQSLGNNHRNARTYLDVARNLE